MLSIRTNSDICREEDYEERTVIYKEILASEEDGSIPNRILRKPSLQEEYAKTQICSGQKAFIYICMRIILAI